MKKQYVYSAVIAMNFLIASCAYEPIEENIFVETNEYLCEENLYEENHEIPDTSPHETSLTILYTPIGDFFSIEDNLYIENLGISHEEYINDLKAISEFRRMEKPYPFIENGLIGFKDDIDGEIVIEAQYLGTLGFFDGLAFVIGVDGSEYKTGYIDELANLVIPLPTAVWGWRFSDGFARIVVEEELYYGFEHVIINGQRGLHGGIMFVNRDGEDVFSQIFIDALCFSEGFARVMLPNGRHAFIDTTGENAFGMEFRHASTFVDGYANIELLDGTRTRIDRSGNIVGR